jgi:hypothetical protein
MAWWSPFLVLYIYIYMYMYIYIYIYGTLWTNLERMYFRSGIEAWVFLIGEKNFDNENEGVCVHVCEYAMSQENAYSCALLWIFATVKIHVYTRTCVPYVCVYYTEFPHLFINIQDTCMYSYMHMYVLHIHTYVCITLMHRCITLTYRCTCVFHLHTHVGITFTYTCIIPTYVCMHYT